MWQENGRSRSDSSSSGSRHACWFSRIRCFYLRIFTLRSKDIHHVDKTVQEKLDQAESRMYDL